MNKRALILSLCFCFLCDKGTLARTEYQVGYGDTIWEISLNYDVGLEQLIHANPQIRNPNLIFPGDIIVIPGGMKSRNPSLIKTNENTILELTNAKRSQSGLKLLVYDVELSKIATLKSEDMKQNEYIAHHSPTYGDPAIMLNDMHIPFRDVKENIGAGYESADELFSAWMNSPVNRGNLLNENGTHIGIGYIEGGLHRNYWTILIVER